MYNIEASIITNYIYL